MATFMFTYPGQVLRVETEQGAYDVRYKGASYNYGEVRRGGFEAIREDGHEVFVPTGGIAEHTTEALAAAIVAGGESPYVYVV